MPRRRELAPLPRTPRMPRGTAPDLVPLTGELADAVLALAGEAAAVPLLRNAGAYEEANELMRRGDALAADVAARVLGTEDAPEAAAVRERAQAQLDALRGGPGGRAVPRSLRWIAKPLLGEVGWKVREQALERGSEMMLATDRGGALVVFVAPVTEAQAHVWLLGPLYERVERWVEESHLLDIEREAARWWFSRWRPRKIAAQDDFASVVREQEFSLVERPYAMLGSPPMRHMVEHGLLADAGPRQRHMAAQLARSVAGAWEVERHANGTALFRHPLTRVPYSVREHGDIAYPPGAVAIGRLIPFGDGSWFRSPGALLLPEAPGRLARDVAEGLKLRHGSYPQALLEALVQTVMGAKNLPRDVPLDMRPDTAADLLRDLGDGLQAAGAVREMDPDEVPESLREGADPADTKMMSFEVDEVLAEFFGAMFKLSRKSKSVRDVLRRRERDAKRRKG